MRLQSDPRATWYVGQERMSQASQFLNVSSVYAGHLCLLVPRRTAKVAGQGFVCYHFNLTRSVTGILLTSYQRQTRSERPTTQQQLDGLPEHRTKTVESIHTTVVTSISRLCRRVRPLLLRSLALQCGFQPFLHH